MKTISVPIDDDLLQSVERTANTLHVTLTAFIQSALRLSLQRQNLQELEIRHKQGYMNKPVELGEFSVWEEEQVWGDSSAFAGERQGLS